MTNIILCGGVGSRLWPLSRTHLPKQFARLLPGDSLFEATVRRNQAMECQVLVASNRDQSFLAATQLGEMGISRWKAVVEPVGRNTAPAIALACLMLPADEVVLVTPSDHYITKTVAYQAAVAAALDLAKAGKLVTFGIRPEYPETGFGYIQTDKTTSTKVLAFREKPDLDTARDYVASGDYWWNSGMFCFTAGTFLEELGLHSPAVLAAARVALQSAPKGDALVPTLEAMQAIPSISIDYAVMEKSQKVACITCDIGWSDLGSFDALYDHLRAVGSQPGETLDAAANALACVAEPVIVDSRNNLVINGERTVALIDVQDLLVIESHDALLVAKRGSSQKVKQVVDVLKSRKSELTETFPRVERPWGNYAVLHEETGYKVKRIEVKCGQRLSLQRHEHREEHWTVVAGAAVVQVEKSRLQLGIGQSVMIPRGSVHRLENPGSTPVVIVETQLGDYLGEDDIVRLEDDYLRG
jgi:mannose-1-phosphate guanylyltransferase